MTDNTKSIVSSEEESKLFMRGVYAAAPIAGAVGVLSGMLEVACTYLAPQIITHWEIASPETPGELWRFYVAAAAVDGLLGLSFGMILVFVWMTLGRLGIRPRRVRLVSRALIIAVAACCLFNGWSAAAILSSGKTETALQRVFVAGGIFALIAGAVWLACYMENALDRGRRYVPVAVWISAAAASIVVVLMLYQSGKGSRGKDDGSACLPADAERPNIVLVTIDTLRADYVGAYGHSWIETPTLDSLSHDGAAFEAAISQAPSTTPSHCTLVTSTYPFDHGAENGRPMKPELVTLAQTLRGVGYETAAFVSATTTRSVNTGLQKGFDVYSDSLVSWSEYFGRDELQHLMFFYLSNIVGDTQISGEVVTDRALHWLDRREDGPFFVWLHYFDPHEPYGSEGPFEGMYANKADDGAPMWAERARYAEDITYADYQLGRFVDELKHRGLYDGSLLIVTSDHGEAFGERHAHITEVGHGQYLSDVTQRVPLIVKTPGEREGGRRVQEQVELIDVAPTVLAWLGMAAPAGFAGHSFAGLLDGSYPAYEDRYAYSFTTIHVDDAEAPSGRLYLRQFGARTAKWKYIERPRLEESELYDLSRDPREVYDISGTGVEATELLRAALGAFREPLQNAPEDPRQGLSPSLARQLELLGYIDDEAK